MVIAGVVGVGALALAVVLISYVIRLQRDAYARSVVDKRIVKEVEPVVEAYLRDLPRLVQTGKYYAPDGTPLRAPNRSFSREVHEASSELDRLTFVNRYGAFDRLSGQGFERPSYPWMLIERLELRRTAHMANGSVSLTIYVDGTSDQTIRAGGIQPEDPTSWAIWVSHPDFKGAPDPLPGPVIGLILAAAAVLVAAGTLTWVAWRLAGRRRGRAEPGAAPDRRGR